MEKTKIIKIKNQEFTQVILPVRAAIKLRSIWNTADETQYELTLIETILANCFDRPYTLDDFTSIIMVDELVKKALQNQYSDMGK